MEFFFPAQLIRRQSPCRGSGNWSDTPQIAIVEEPRRKGQTPNRATLPTVELLVGYRLPAGWHTRGVSHAGDRGLGLRQGSTGYPRRRQPCRPPANGRAPRTSARRRWKAARAYRAARAVLA